MGTTSERSAALEPIDNQRTYPLPVFKRLTGLSDWAVRKAKAKGLKVIRVGNRAYVRGSDWSEFLAAEAGMGAK